MVGKKKPNHENVETAEDVLCRVFFSRTKKG